MTAGRSTEHMLGVAMVLASAAVFGLAGVLTKSIHAEPLIINCWRGLVGGLCITAYVFWRRSGETEPKTLRLGWRGWLMAIVGAAASVAFIAAFKNTYVANVAISYATAPFLAALLAFILVGERVRSQTAVAAGFSIAGVGLMVFSGLGTGRLFGDLLALLMTFGSSLYIVLIRKFRDTPAVWAGAVSAFLLFAVGWFLTDPLSVSMHDAFLLIAFGGSFALASVLWTEGSRLIPAAESGLLGAAEVPFAVMFGWLFLAELPPATSLVGGLVVLGAVIWHAGRDWRVARLTTVSATG